MNSNILSMSATKAATLIITSTLAIATFFGLTMTACSPSSPGEGSGEVVDGSAVPTDASATPTDGSASVTDAVVEDTLASEDAVVSDGSGSAPADDAAVSTEDAVVLDPVDAVLDTDTPDAP